MYAKFRTLSGSVAAGIKRTTDNTFIPADDKNRDWIEYQAWLEENDEPEDPPELPVAPVATPDTISDRQFAHGLFKAGLITFEEAKAWVGPGTLPAAITSFLQSLPEEQREDVEMVLVGATTFSRSHPLTATFGDAVGMTSQQLDAFWTMCAGL